MKSRLALTAAIDVVSMSLVPSFSQQSSNLGAAAAASLMAVAPVLIAYLFLQKFFTKGDGRGC